jgi:hypothetical protein
MNNRKEETLLTIKQWSKIESEMCRVLEFTPMTSFENNKITKIDTNTPYASITFECSNQSEILRGFVGHKEDFKALWYIFKERKLDSDEEVLFIWSNKHYKNLLYSLLSRFMPKLWIMICKKSSFEIITNLNYRPELTGEARALASKSLEDFKPDVME